MAHRAISIPKRLRKKLAEDGPLEGFVHQSLDRFEPWLKDSGMPFFRGFTDHGPEHLRRVLDAADWLIVKEAFAVMSPSDVACLVLAILLHDIAMHLTEDSFRASSRHPRQ